MDDRKFDEEISKMFHLDLPTMPELQEDGPIRMLNMGELDMLIAAGSSFNSEQIEQLKNMKNDFSAAEIPNKNKK